MSDPRLEAILDQLMRIASGDLAFRGEVSGAEDELDAIVAGLNMLAEDFMLQQSRAHATHRDMAELFERAPVMLFTLDLVSGTVLRANRTMLERQGPAEKHVVGVPLREHVEPTSLEDFDDALALLREGTDIRGLELVLTPCEGPPYVALLSAVKASDARRRARCTLVDVQDRRVLEAELLESQKLEAIGRLAGGVAHDFNNLLTIIQNYTAMVRQVLPDETEEAEDLDAVLDASAKAAALTGQLLAFSRRQVIRPKVLQLNELVERTRRLLVRLLGENIDVSVALHPDCWPVRIDAGQFGQILVNLAVNARDAMPGGGRLTIETANVVLDEEYAQNHSEVVAGEYTMLAITDTGEGMAPDVVGHVFEPFFTTKAVGSGTGLGLATCYGIVRQAGGHIWLYSELGRGTTFKIYLPRVRQPAEAFPVDAVVPGEDLRGNETVLLLENDDHVRSVAERILRGAGYTVVAAATGRDAKEAFAERSESIDLFLTDIVLRNTTGHEVACALRARVPELPVVYCSGYPENSVVHDGVLEPGVDFVAKPFNADELLRTIRVALS